jgi:hypothetical protein
MRTQVIEDRWVILHKQSRSAELSAPSQHSTRSTEPILTNGGNLIARSLTAPKKGFKAQLDTLPSHVQADVQHVSHTLLLHSDNFIPPTLSSGFMSVIRHTVRERWGISTWNGRTLPSYSQTGIVSSIRERQQIPNPRKLAIVRSCSTRSRSRCSLVRRLSRSSCS